MTSLRKLVESARVTMPQPRFAGYATLFFSLSVLTFVISLAASEASLMAAALCYAIEQLRAPRLGQHSRPALRFPFPPVRLRRSPLPPAGDRAAFGTDLSLYLDHPDHSPQSDVPGRTLRLGSCRSPPIRNLTELSFTEDGATE